MSLTKITFFFLLTLHVLKFLAIFIGNTIFIYVCLCSESCLSLSAVSEKNCGMELKYAKHFNSRSFPGCRECAGRKSRACAERAARDSRRVKQTRPRIAPGSRRRVSMSARSRREKSTIHFRSVSRVGRAR